jgi:hypothetical protein
MPQGIPFFYPFLNIIFVSFPSFMKFARHTLLKIVLYLAVATGLVSASCKKDPDPVDPELFQLLRVRANETTLTTSFSAENLPVTPTFTIEFSSPVDTVAAKSAITLVTKPDSIDIPLVFRFVDAAKTIQITSTAPLFWNTSFLLHLKADLKGAQKQPFPGIQFEIKTVNGTLSISTATLNRSVLNASSRHRNVAFDTLDISITFSSELSETNLKQHVSLSPATDFSLTLSSDKKTVRIRNNAPLDYYRRYSFSVLSTLTGTNGFSFNGFTKTFVTGLNPAVKKPALSDEELITLVQRQTFKYFWDFAHPVSGLARERNSSGDIVTIGGSGFGIMGIPVGIERGFITRDEGISRLDKIVTFLGNADRFHGVWPHWMNGNTGRTIPFSTNDNGGDLVETSFMAQGLVTVRQYLNPLNETEASIISKINVLLNTIEWNWYTRSGQNVLYWHWSADKAWAMNMQIRGYNEALITYVMAATSSTYGIEKAVYTSGWANNGGIRNNKSFYGITLPVGYDYGGPLFFAHYSFLGLDPRNLSDTYANYWTQNVNHSLINREHCVRNPAGNVGYGAFCWGLTASDNPSGYGVHEPTRDPGTITPTAALSSFPYTPEQSMEALKHFYLVLGDKLWGDYGFYDAFNANEGWFASSFLAIDQGPILVMIENHRSGLLWDLFMSAPEVKTGLDKLGFTYTASPKHFQR